MVIRQNDIDPQRFAQFDFFKRGDTGINGDQKGDVLFRVTFNDIAVETVPLSGTGGDVVGNARTLTFQIRVEQDG